MNKGKTKTRNLVIEITRRCNMSCDHCLRGDPENVVIEKRHIDKLFSELSHVSDLTITGGEPSLHPEMIDYIVESAEKHGVSIDNFYMVTNAKKVSDHFLKAIIGLYAYCGYMEEGIGGLSISGDGYHDELNKDNVRKLEAFRFTSIRDEGGKRYDDNLINEGRSVDNHYTTKEINFCEFEVLDDVIEGDAELYLNCLGDLVGSCNLSYDTQTNKNLIIANVHDKDFNLRRSVQSYNKRIKHLDYEERTVEGISELAMVA